MPILAFTLALTAAIIFLIEAAHRSLLALGLALLTVALIVQYVHPVADITWR